MVSTAPGISAAIVEAGSHALLVAVRVLAIRRDTLSDSDFQYTDSFRYIWAVAIPFIVLGTVGLLFLRSTVDDMDARVDRGVEDTRHKVLSSED